MPRTRQASTESSELDPEIIHERSNPSVYIRPIPSKPAKKRKRKNRERGGKASKVNKKDISVSLNPTLPVEASCEHEIDQLQQFLASRHLRDQIMATANAQLDIIEYYSQKLEKETFNVQTYGNTRHDQIGNLKGSIQVFAEEVRTTMKTLEAERKRLTKQEPAKRKTSNLEHNYSRGDFFAPGMAVQLMSRRLDGQEMVLAKGKILHQMGTTATLEQVLVKNTKYLRHIKPFPGNTCTKITDPEQRQLTAGAFNQDHDTLQIEIQDEDGKPRTEQWTSLCSTSLESLN